MSQKPLVSIITPAYNAARFIAETIDSVQAQTFQDWELIIADDGSKDDTLQIITQYAAGDHRIKLVRLPGNSGPARARNAALEKATGRYVCFLDSDDIWLPNKLQVQLDFLRSKNAAFCFSQFRRITQDGSQTGRLIPVPERVNYRTLLKHNVIATLTTMIDTEKTGPLHMTDEGYDDFICWLGIVRRGHDAFGIQQDLARYRVVEGSVSNKRMRAIKWVWNIYRNVEKLPLPVAFWIFANYAARTSLKHRQF